jgi:quinol monooxygenase YgiN
MAQQTTAQVLTVVAELKAKPGREEDLRRALLALIEPTRQEEGYVQYDLHVHTGDPSRFVFYENWTSREHLDRHLATPHLQEFLGTADALLADPPRIETYWRIA